MRTQTSFSSCGEGRITVTRWIPDVPVMAVVQIVHGIAEYALRYDDFARYLNDWGILVVAEDHMGHGDSMQSGTQGYFAGGWNAAVGDTYQLLLDTRAEYPDVPYILFGHSMGSFMARTILLQHPDSGIIGAIICGTGWMPDAVVSAGEAVGRLIAKLTDERQPSPLLQGIAFGAYNNKIQHRRTDFDWLTRDERIVDAYISDPKCGFIASCGLMRDMMAGIRMIQNRKALSGMNAALPVLFIAGQEDPVGDYGKGVRKAAEEFRKAGVQDVTLKLFPLCRHEILNEINREEIYGDILNWIRSKVEEICGNNGKL